MYEGLPASCHATHISPQVPHMCRAPCADPRSGGNNAVKEKENQARGHSPSSQDFSFSCAASALPSSLAAKKSPYECAEEGPSPAYAG